MKVNVAHILLPLFVIGYTLPDPIDVLQIPERGFFSEKPADCWNESLLSGNGTMGVMVMGKPYSDTIITNHALLYMPINEPLLPVSQGKYLDEIRNTMLQGDYGKASQFVVDLSHKEGYHGKQWPDPYVPALDLTVRSPALDKQYSYARTVNFETGVVEVKWLLVCYTWLMLLSHWVKASNFMTC